MGERSHGGMRLSYMRKNMKHMAATGSLKHQAQRECDSWLCEKCFSALKHVIRIYLLADQLLQSDKRAVWLGSFILACLVGY
jgi:hypothetical protein